MTLTAGTAAACLRPACVSPPNGALPARTRELAAPVSVAGVQGVAQLAAEREAAPAVRAEAFAPQPLRQRLPIVPVHHGARHRLSRRLQVLGLCTHAQPSAGRHPKPGCLSRRHPRACLVVPSARVVQSVAGSQNVLETLEGPRPRALALVPPAERPPLASLPAATRERERARGPAGGGGRAGGPWLTSRCVCQEDESSESLWLNMPAPRVPTIVICTGGSQRRLWTRRRQRQRQRA